MMDGLKPGQRKILFGCFKRKLKGEIKVMQLAGYVSEHAAYHHGEQSLCQTIVGLAQNYVGSNNLNLLEPNGQFGTRLQGGKDAASPRYIFTALSPFARAVFRPEDDALLRYLNDDGQSIEPAWYSPILPMVLVNGCEGIGTGWSTSVPSYNPGEIAENLLKLMDGQEPTAIHPWYSGFRGTIEPIDESCSKYRVAGSWRKIDDTTLEIFELPVGSWTQNYKEWLEGLLTGDAANNLGLRDYKEHHTDATVRFLLHMTETGMEAGEKEGIEKRFRLSTTLALTNLVCFDPAGRIKKYTEGPNQIIRDFYDVRLGLYQRRKEHLADVLTRDWTVLDNKVRFITEIVNGSLVVQKRRKGEIVAELKARGYHSVALTEGQRPVEEEGVEPPQSDEPTAPTASSGSFDYLLRMPIYALTQERIHQLETERSAKESALNALLALTPKDLWRSDLNEFLALWNSREDSKNLSLARLAAAGSSGGADGGKQKAKPKAKKAATAASATLVATAASKRAASISSDDDDDEEESVVYGKSDSDDNEEFYASKSKKAPVATKSNPAEIEKPAAAKKPPVKRAKSSEPIKAGPLDSSITRRPPPVAAPAALIESEDEMDLPLSERIARMLARKASAVVSTAAADAATTGVQIVKAQVSRAKAPARAPRAAAKPAPSIVMLSDDDEEMPTVEAAMEMASSPRKPKAKPAAKAKPKSKRPSPILSDSDEEEVFEVSDSDDVFEISN